eukprot:m.1515614 g.1515614  ORF g.1515614 m.1515614 type:complete len:89 (+) comp25217_c0_seq23:5611-5877(+)
MCHFSIQDHPGSASTLSSGAAPSSSKEYDLDAADHRDPLGRVWCSHSTTTVASIGLRSPTEVCEIDQFRGVSGVGVMTIFILTRPHIR